jgi:hypothetical protein
MTLSRLSDKMARFCRTTMEAMFSPTFTAPSDLTFDSEGSEGTSEDLVRSDHVHGLPAVSADPFDEISTIARIYREFDITDISGRLITNGTITYGGRGDLGSTGGVGTADIDTGVGDSFGAIYVAQTSNSWDDRTIEPTRLLTFEARVLPGPATGDITNVRQFIGMGRMSASGNIGAAGVGVTEGVGFVLDTSGSTGNWVARVVNASTATTQDMGVGPNFNASSEGEFDTFRITYDPGAGTVRFQILDTAGTSLADETLADTDFPTSQVAGFGIFVEDKDANTRIMSIDYLFVELDRDL